MSFWFLSLFLKVNVKKLPDIQQTFVCPGVFYSNSCFYASTANPSAFITSTTCATYFAHSSSVAASTMTRITGSVPLSQTRIRPSSCYIVNFLYNLRILACCLLICHTDILKKLWIDLYRLCQSGKAHFLLQNYFHDHK